MIVTPNLYGDILSDIAAELTGSVGLAGSANIGEHVAMFEAIHGSAPDLAGRDVANPGGLLLSAVMMLVHVRQAKTASLVHNAWLRTLEEGIHTADLTGAATRRTVGTRAFADAVIDRLGDSPRTLPAVEYSNPEPVTRGSEPAYVRRQAANEGHGGRGRVRPRRSNVARRPGREALSARDPHARAEDDHQPRRQGVAKGTAGDLLHRPLALPLPGGRQLGRRSAIGTSSNC